METIPKKRGRKKLKHKIISARLSKESSDILENFNDYGFKNRAEMIEFALKNSSSNQKID